MEVGSSLQVRSSLWVLGIEGKKKGMLGAAAKYGKDHHRGREMWESLLGFIYSVLHASGSKFFFSFAEAGMVFYERQSESWRLDQGKVRRSEAGRLTEIMYGSLAKCSRMGQTKRWKYFSDEKWKQKPNGWVLENLGILKDEWWVMSDEEW